MVGVYVVVVFFLELLCTTDFRFSKWVGFVLEGLINLFGVRRRVATHAEDYFLT